MVPPPARARNRPTVPGSRRPSAESTALSTLCERRGQKSIVQPHPEEHGDDEPCRWSKPRAERRHRRSRAESTEAPADAEQGAAGEQAGVDDPALRKFEVIEAALKDIPTLQFERIVPPIANHVPHLLLTWDDGRLKVTRARLTQDLMDADPPIQIGRVSGTGDKGVLISVLTLQTGEERIVADRLRAILRRSMGRNNR